MTPKAEFKEHPRRLGLASLPAKMHRMRWRHRAVNDEVLGVGIIGQVLMQVGPNAPVAPLGKALVSGVPVAVFCGQPPPLGAGSGNPEDRGDETFTIGGAPDVDIGTAPQESENLVPRLWRQLHICYPATIPKCQHGLGNVHPPSHTNLLSGFAAALLEAQPETVLQNTRV